MPHRRRTGPIMLTLALFLAGCGALTGVVTPPPTIAQRATPTTIPGAWIKMEPAVAKPGQTVTVAGYVPGARNMGHGDVCFGGCAAGLLEQGVTVHWSGNHFRLKLYVPATAWMSADGPQPLENGTYRVGVRCVGVAVLGCGLARSEVSTVLRLEGVDYQPCPRSGCGRLSLSRNQASPGDQIQLRGWAPLDQIIGKPFPYSVALLSGQPSLKGVSPSAYVLVGQAQQDLAGNLHGSLRIPATINGRPLAAGTYTLALQGFFPTQGGSRVLTAKGKKIAQGLLLFEPATLRLQSGEAWASLGRLHPLGATWSADLFGAMLRDVPGEPNRLVYCRSHGIHLSTDGGANWSVVPVTDAVKLAATATKYTLDYPASPDQVSCASALLDPGHPNTVYASFWGQNPKFGAPPVFQLGFVTTNLGRSWKAVPVPQGYGAGGFAGFQIAGHSVLALFQAADSGYGAWHYTVEATTNGGFSWHPAALTCPAVGPCLRFGPSPSQISGMGAPRLQPLELSTDDGRTWQSPGWPHPVELAQGPGELVPLSSTQALLVSGTSGYPVLRTADGGRTWRYVALPPVPDYQNGAPGLPGAAVLPTGSLLAQDPNTQTWILLAPGATHWCTAAGLPALGASQLTPVGDRLWSLPAGGGATAPAGVPVQKVTCRP